MTRQRNPYTRHKSRHRGITYRVRSNGARSYYVYASGRQHPVTGGEAEALTLQAKLRSKAARGIPVVDSKIKLAAVGKEWLASKTKLRERTHKDYTADLDNIVLPRFGHLKPSQITADALASFIRDLEARGLSGSRIQNILKPLKGAIKLALRRGLIGSDPFDLLTSDERPQATTREHHVWSPAEIKKLLTASSTLAKKRDAKYDYSVLLTVAVYSGLRISELLGLRWCDLDLKKRDLYVRHQLLRDGTLGEPKTPKAVRCVPLAPGLVKLLNKHKLASAYSQDGDFVFPSLNGTPLNARNVVTRGLEPALEVAGLDQVEHRITFHDLRHAFASLMIERGMNSVELATIMGHRDSRTTETIYIHLFDREKTDRRVRAAMQSAMDLTSP